MGDAQRAADARLGRRPRDRAWLALIVKGLTSAMALFTNRLDEAIALSDEVLADPAATPWAVEWAVFGGSLSRALVGRGDEVAALAAKARDAERVTDGLLRFPAGFGEILAPTLPGHLDDAEKAAQRYLDFSLGRAPSGVGALGDPRRGGLRHAGRLCPSRWRGFGSDAGRPGEGGAAASWSYPAFILRVMAPSALGRGEDAWSRWTRRATHDEHVAVFGPSLAIAVALQAAGEGCSAVPRTWRWRRRVLRRREWPNSDRGRGVASCGSVRVHLPVVGGAVGRASRAARRPAHRGCTHGMRARLPTLMLAPSMRCATSSNSSVTNLPPQMRQPRPVLCTRRTAPARRRSPRRRTTGYRAVRRCADSGAGDRGPAAAADGA